MAKFKKGDRVNIISKTVPCYEGTDGIGQIWYVIRIAGDGSGRNEGNCIVANKNPSDIFGYYYRPSDLTLVDKTINNSIKPFMTTVNTMMKKLLDGDTQKLIKAGYINGDLLLTEKGRQELEALQFQAHKAELVELAKAELEETKK